MKRLIPLFFLLTTMIVAANANPVDLNRASTVGAKFLYANTVTKTDNPSELQLFTTYRTADNEAAFYVFNSYKGFVMVAADDCATPILGYSNRSSFTGENLPVQLDEYLQHFVEQIQYGIEHHLSADETIARQWELVLTTGRLTEEKGTMAVSPLLTDTWNQSCYYNNRCPEDADGPCGHVYAGCAATSFSQILHYWNFPVTGTGSHSYTPEGYPTQSVNFGATTYQWANMPDNLSAYSSAAQIDAVATLMWHCGVAINMNYGPAGSGASPSAVYTAFVDYFNYSTDITAASRSNYSDTQWLNMIKNDLNSGRPIHYSGWNSSGDGGHGFVCDGYDSNDMLHFNWGWGGYCNDNYYALDALTPSSYDFSYSNYAIFNIHPNCDPGTTYQVNATASPSNGGTVSGGGTFGCNDLCTLTAVPASGYTFCSWTENGIQVSTNPTYSFSVLADRNLVANFIETSGNSCTLVFTLNDSYGDGWNGNALTVSYSEGCTSSEELTMDNGSTTTITRTVIDGSHIVLGWLQGNWMEECSFTISYGNGVVIYEGTNLNGTNYEFDVICDGAYYTINASANPVGGGNVSGAGTYFVGDLCTLTASPNANYVFVNWSKATGEVVSTNPTYSFNVTADASFVANFNAVSAGYGELDYSYYDWQSNCGARTWTHVWPDGKVNFAYTMATQQDFSDRGTGIGTYDSYNDDWIPSGSRIENEKTGFGSIAQYGTNGIVVAAHTATQCCVYIIPDKDNYTPGSISRVSALDPTKDPTWPSVMTSGPNRNIIHVIATGYSDNTMYYFRSQDGGVTWDKQNMILPYMTTEYCEHFNANSCYWMETTEDNCLALVVNNAWSDGMVIYSYDNGETWERKVFYSHPGPHNAIPDGGWFFYPRWTSCQWDSQHRLHVLYEFNATTGAVGSGSFYPSVGGVAYWNETMPYNGDGTVISAIPGNLTPGQPFVMDSAYMYQDIYASWWLWSDASHEMWPEYVGYLAPLTDDGNPEDPYTASYFNIEDRGLHGSYNSGVCGFPVLCMVPGTDEMVALWSAMDENHTDENGNYYYKLFARYSNDGGLSWSPMVHLTNDFLWDYQEFVYNQAAVVGRKLIIASQTDGTTGTYVQSDDSDASDNYYQGFVFDIDELFDTAPVQQFTITATASPSNLGNVTGGGTYNQGTYCTLRAFPNDGVAFTHWTKNGNTVSTNAVYSFIVTEDATFVAHFTDQAYTITATANPVEGGMVTGAGTFLEGATCTLTATTNTGYTFDNWSTADGAVVSTDPTYSFIVTGNASFVANFNVITSYQITATADPTAGGTVTGAGSYYEGSTCTLSATANTGYSFVNWTAADGVVVATDPTYTFTVTEDASFVAHFIDQVVTFTITATADPVEGGVVSGGGTYNAGDICTLAAVNNDGYDFVNWTKNGNIVSTSASFSFNVTEDADYVAHFMMPSFVVTVNANPAEGGVVSGGGNYSNGATATVSVTPNPNYVFINWTENGTEVSTEPSFSFVVTQNRQLIANLDFVDAIDNQETENFAVYPNPVYDVLTIEAPETIRNCEVYGFDGSLVYSVALNNNVKKQQIDVKHLSKGTYLVRLTTDTAVLTKRFVKQ